MAVPNEITRQLDLSDAHLQVESLADMALEALLSEIDRATINQDSGKEA